MEGVSQFKELIYTMKVQDVGEDILVWKEGRKGLYSVKSYCSSLCAKTRVEFLAKEI